MSAVAVNKSPSLFLPWLEKQINRGKYDGVEWLNQDKQVFKIPWVHARKTEFCLKRDATLPRDWTKRKHRYKSNKPKEVKNWKINFCCALRGTTRIVELKQFRIEYPRSRVFQILPLDYMEVITSKTILPFPCPISCSSGASCGSFIRGSKAWRCPMCK